MRASLVRVFGSLVMAVGLCAVGLARIEDLRSQRRAVTGFIWGHVAVWFALATQSIAIWDTGIGSRARDAVFAAIALQVYARATNREPEGQSTAALRSEYERQIRQAAAQEERNRLARDLHDSIKQQLFVVQTSAATAQARFEEDRAGARDAIEQVRAAAREGLTEMQAMLDQLRAGPIENAGLIASIAHQCEALGFRTGAKVEWKVGTLPSNQQMPPGSQDTLLRVAQEALANIGRHARARNVSVSLGVVRRQVELRIVDDGAGFDTNSEHPGMGISNMRTRAEEFGGTFEVISRPGEGTTVVFSLPCLELPNPADFRTHAICAAILLIGSTFVWSRTGSIPMLAVVILAAWKAVDSVIRYRRAVRASVAA